MRIKKYRIWDQNENKMIYNECTNYIHFKDDGTINCFGYPLNNIVLEFTGIKDKNKSEIFESDILTDNKNKWVVEWHDQGAKWWLKRIVNNNLKGDDYLIECIDNYDLGNGYYTRMDLEIIGNIYENKDLLK